MGSKSLDKTETYLTVLWEEFQVCLSPLMLMRSLEIQSFLPDDL